MKNKHIVLGALFLLFSGVSALAQSSSVVGGDSDKHGCKGSAG